MDKLAQVITAGFLSFVVAAIIFIALEIVICKQKRATRSQTQATRANQVHQATLGTQATTAPQAPTPITVSNPTPRPITIAAEVSASFDPSLQISMSDIIAATKNFSADLIAGDGRFGFVYKAELSNGLNLAVKKLDPDAFQCFMEFRSEHEILGKLRHRNIGAERALIFDFFDKGNLDICLHGSLAVSAVLEAEE